MKKSQVEIQFNWIFILIAGGLILTFFIFIAKGYGKTAEQTLSIETLTKLDAIITGQEATEGKEDRIEISKDIILDFDCVGYSTGGIRPQPTTSSVVFSPVSTKGTLLTWTKSWDAPFRVMNFIYITSPDIRYYIIGKEDVTAESLTKEIFDALPDNTDKIQVKYDGTTYEPGIEYYNNYHVRLVYVDVFPSDDAVPVNLWELKNDEVSAVGIDSSYLYVDFFRKNGNIFLQESLELPYFSNEFLYGAIYSGNAELYECNLEKAKKRFEHVAKIYKSRTSKLAELGNSPPNCIDFYQTTYFRNLIDYIESDDPAQFQETMLGLEHQNDATIYQSCPSLY